MRFRRWLDDILERWLGQLSVYGAVGGMTMALLTMPEEYCTEGQWKAFLIFSGISVVCSVLAAIYCMNDEGN